jgi:CO/xanthine dehydrogenase Mo-binding subunit
LSIATETGTREVGRSRTRLDAREKLRGEAVFTGDLEVPGMLHGRVLRAEVPHAEIISIDTSAAERMPGVAAVLVGRDLLDIDPYYGHAIKDRPIVAIERVRFNGEPVAAVAAEDPATADAALRAIEVVYDELPLVDTIDRASRMRRCSTRGRSGLGCSTGSGTSASATATSATATA